MMQEYLSSVISDIQQSKKDIKPDYAMMNEIAERVLNDMRQTLRDMTHAGLIDYHVTLNSVAFSMNTK